MTASMKTLLLGVALLWAAPVDAGAQAHEMAHDTTHAQNYYGAWGGLAQNSRPGLFGATPGRDVAVTAFRITIPLGATDWVAWDWVGDIVPAAWVSMPSAEFIAGPCEGSNLCGLRVAFSGQDAAYGFGAAPLGMQLRFRPGRVLQPYVAGSGGMLWFQREIPIQRAAQMNFTADAGVGLLVGKPGHLGVMAGYKLHHISNAGTARLNPGMDNYMIYAGLLRIPR
jgi:Lipid A 3-O-deacylase (PagL)